MVMKSNAFWGKCQSAEVLRSQSSLTIGSFALINRHAFISYVSVLPVGNSPVKGDNQTVAQELRIANDQ